MPKIEPQQVWPMFKKLPSAQQALDSAPKYSAGDEVHTNHDTPKTHTRLAGYVRGRNGVVERYLGAYRFADAYASDRKEAQHVYSVRFDGAELWGKDCEPNTCVYIEMYESYLEKRHD